MIPGSELARGNLNPTPSLVLAAAFLSLSAFCLSNSSCLSDFSLPSLLLLSVLAWHTLSHSCISVLAKLLSPLPKL